VLGALKKAPLDCGARRVQEGSLGQSSLRRASMDASGSKAPRDVDSGLTLDLGKS
jgi:hypothetical protein